MILVIAVALTVVNCSATGKVTQVKAYAPKSTTSESIQIFLDKSAIVGSDESNMALNLFENALMSKLKSATKHKFFTAQEKCTPACKFKVEIVFTHINEVTDSKRALAGAFAGRAKIEGNGKILDIKSLSSLGEFTLEELSSGGTVLAGTTKDVAKAGGDRLAQYLLLEFAD